MDPIANMIVQIKNGYMAKKDKVDIPYSKFKLEIAKLLESEGRVGKVKKDAHAINIELLYRDKAPAINEIKRVSKPGLRVYQKSKKIKQLKAGKGTIILSTPEGVMTAQAAKKKNLGGEVICLLW